MLVYREFKPSAPLQNIVRCFFYYENTCNPSAIFPEIVSPDGTFEINFQLDPHKSREMKVYHLALLSRPRIVKPTDIGKVLGITFYPWGIYSLFGMPSREIIDFKINAEELLGSKLNVLYEHVVNAGNPESAIPAIEKYLIEACTERDLLIEDISQRIIASKGTISMSALFSAYGISKRRIEQRFLDKIGVSPKFFARLIKYQQTLVQLKKYSACNNLTGIAYKCGYFDQSHFIRDFKSFSGVTPAKYISSKHTFDDIMLGAVFNRM